ncbi:DNA-3-methyladenine glycosylase I [Roseibium aestuarii]|uniref:DNA-3-methyladenine glycosylase I n=1 Tax=Roseibium aestuarii TaxID=2600299 RepID=A0ABW4JUJ1_9HYPH|nr:DNA-3-methyladenine glycosylase I [Roseibium aestuarii]
MSDQSNAPDLPEGLILGDDGKARCWWHGGLEDYQRYHDEEWGWPVDEDRRLFEKLCLEGFQSGLSWLTILRKREAFRAAFANFEAEKVARFDDTDIARCLADAGIVRHRGKILSVINNARRVLELKQEAGSLAAFIWSFEPPERELAPVKGTIPGSTAESTALSKALKKRGWSFVGPTTVYAFMQSMGMVNDHLDGCCCRAPVHAARLRFVRPQDRAAAPG